MSYYEKVYPSYLRVPSIKQLRLYVLKYQKGSILPILNMFKFMVVLLTFVEICTRNMPCFQGLSGCNESCTAYNWIPYLRTHFEDALQQIPF